jgi:hypothetical protein
MRDFSQIVFLFSIYFVIFLLEYIGGFEDQRLPLINGSLSNKGSAIVDLLIIVFVQAFFNLFCREDICLEDILLFVHFPFF